MVLTKVSHTSSSSPAAFATSLSASRNASRNVPRSDQTPTKPAQTCRACEHSKLSPETLVAHTRTLSVDTSPLADIMDSRHGRTLSPGSHGSSNPARSSTGTFDQYGDPYYSRSSRDYAPSRTDKFYPYQSSSGYYDAYAARPRRSTYDRIEPEYSPPRQRHHERDEYRPRKERHKIYDVDEKHGARLVGEREVRARDYDYDEVPRSREQRHAPRGTYTRSRDVDEDEYSYTDPAGMYRDTEPSRRRRRGSLDRGHAYEKYEADDQYVAPRTSARDFAATKSRPKDSDRLNGSFRRHETLDERSLSRSRDAVPDRSNTYDPYLAPTGREPSSRSRRPVSMMDLSQDQAGRDRARESDGDGEAPRRSRGRYKDEQVQSRGFGLRNVSSHGSDLAQEKVPLAIEPPPPRKSTVDSYGPEGELLPPDPSDYLPQSSKEDPTRSRRHDDRLDEARRERKADGKQLSQQRDDLQSSRRKDRTRHLDTDSDDDLYAGKSSRRPHHRDPRRYDDGKARERDPDSDGSERHHRLRDATATTLGAGAAAYALRDDDDRRVRDHDRDRDQPRTRPKARDDDVNRDRLSQDVTRDRERASYDDERMAAKVLPQPRESHRSRNEVSDTTRLRDEEQSRRSSKESEFSEVDRKLHDLRIDSAQAERADRSAATLPSRRANRDHTDDGSSDDEVYQRSLRKERDRTRGYEDHRGYEKDDLDDRRPQKHKRIMSDEDEDGGDEDYRRRVLQSQQELKSYDTVPPPPPPPGSYPIDASGPGPDPSTLLGAGLSSEPLDVDGGESRSREKSRVRIVEPPKEDEPAPVVKSILRKPTDKFPDHPNTVREGVMPLKEEAAKRGIPTGARWTKIKRSLVNPDALIQAKERFEERQDYVIVLRVLSKDEIQQLADLTSKIRSKRDEEYEREKGERGEKSSRPEKGKAPKSDKDLDESDDTDVDDREPRRRKEHDDHDRDRPDDKDSKRHRDAGKDRDRDPGTHHDRERERDRHRDRYAERERNRDRD